MYVYTCIYYYVQYLYSKLAATGGVGIGYFRELVPIYMYVVHILHSAGAIYRSRMLLLLVARFFFGMSSYFITII